MDQFVLVTGANKGIGQAIAAQLADAGYTVYLGSRNAERGERAAEVIAGDGRDVRVIALDVTDQASVDAAAARISAEPGGWMCWSTTPGSASVVVGRRARPVPMT